MNEYILQIAAQSAELLAGNQPMRALEVAESVRLDEVSSHEELSAILKARLIAMNALGRWRDIAELGREWLPKLRERHLNDALCRLHGHVGHAFSRLGAPRLAESHLRAAIHIATWDLVEASRAVLHQRQLAILFKNLARWQQAKFEILGAIETADEASLAHESGALRINLAVLYLKTTGFQEVQELLDQAERHLRIAGRLEWLIQASLARVRFHVMTGRVSEALDIALPALDSVRDRGASREEAICLEYIGDCFLQQKEFKKALDYFGAAQAIADSTAPKGDLVPELGHRIGEALVNLGDPNGAILACERGLRVARDTGDRYEECATYRVLAMANWASGNPRKALRLAAEGVELGRSYEIPYELARALQWMGEARLQGNALDERASARRHLWEARAIYERLGIVHATKAIEKLLGFETQPEPPSDEPGIDALRDLENLDRGALRFGIVTCSPEVSEAVATIQSIAPSRIPVLIGGQSGVGKELFAKALHLMSDRRKGPFVAVNCGALSPTLLDSEFFGHERGAFTGAVAPREGLIASAHQGTLFLDEIGDLAVSAQSTLLRVLETGELRPLGRDDVRKIDVRIVAATNASLDELVERGSFRRDLFYRLNGVSVTLPSLQEREEDIRALFRYLWAQAAAAAKKSLTLSDDVEAMLCAYAWPGNVRELKHEIARVVALAEPHSRVGRDAFLPKQRNRSAESLRRSREQVAASTAEREEILRALRAHRGNKAEAARSLGGMKRTTLIYKIERHGIRPEEYLVNE